MCLAQFEAHKVRAFFSVVFPELGSHQHGRPDGASGFASNESVHRESGRQGCRCHPAVILSFRGRERAEGKTAGTPEVTEVLLLLMYSDLILQDLIPLSKLPNKILYEMYEIADLTEIVLTIYS